MKNVLIITASNGQNLKLAKDFQKEYEQLDASAEILDLVDLDLPLYSPAAEGKGIPSQLEKHLFDLEKADALVVIAPEYNGGVPPTLTNFIAWTSRSSKDWRKYFNGKKTAIASFSGGGGINVLNSMRIQLAYVGANVVGRHVQANFGKELNPEDIPAVARLSLN
tara:strand:- start:152138 stop:152632 length:495 start_codon:yes stop_codon:yes gene_type:complete